MSHDRSTRANNVVWLSPCLLQSHRDCEHEDCQVKECAHLYDELTAGQIRVGVATAIAGLIVSTVFAVGVLWVWISHALLGHQMPGIPLLITSIASAPFAAGVITSLKIPKRARIKLEQK